MPSPNLLIIVYLGLLAGCAKPKFSAGTNEKAAPPPAAPTNPAKPGTGTMPLPDPGPGPGPGPGPSPDLAQTCTNAADKIKTLTQAITFPERLGCEWDQPSAPDSNLGKVNLHVQAREEQTLTLNLPAGTLCEMEVASKNKDSKIRYDDFMVLSVDKHVLLATNKELMTPMEKQGNVFLWDFAKIRGAAINWEATHYCLGSSDADCQVPKTEQTGVFDLKMKPEAIAPISAAISGKSSVPLTLVSTGDNDADKDCAHTPIDLTVSMRYIPK